MKLFKKCFYWVLLGVIACWMIGSYFEIVSQNLDPNPEYSPWNFLLVLRTILGV